MLRTFNTYTPLLMLFLFPSLCIFISPKLPTQSSSLGQKYPQLNSHGIFYFAHSFSLNYHYCSHIHYLQNNTVNFLRVGTRYNFIPSNIICSLHRALDISCTQYITIELKIGLKGSPQNTTESCDLKKGKLLTIQKNITQD